MTSILRGPIMRRGIEPFSIDKICYGPGVYFDCFGYQTPIFLDYGIVSTKRKEGVAFSLLT